MTSKASKRKMKALVVHKLGDPTKPLNSSALKLETAQQVPLLPAAYVRVRIAAASLNFADLLQVQGSYQVSVSIALDIEPHSCLGACRCHALALCAWCQAAARLPHWLNSDIGRNVGEAEIAVHSGVRGVWCRIRSRYVRVRLHEGAIAYSS